MLPGTVVALVPGLAYVRIWFISLPIARLISNTLSSLFPKVAHAVPANAQLPQGRCRQPLP